MAPPSLAFWRMSGRPVDEVPPASAFSWRLGRPAVVEGVVEAVVEAGPASASCSERHRLQTQFDRPSRIEGRGCNESGRQREFSASPRREMK